MMIIDDSETDFMKPINTRIHGILDYVVGTIIFISPWLFDFATKGSPQMLTPALVGIVGILYSLLTAYEYGVIKVIPMRMHLVFDYIGGAILAASPWLFGFAHVVFWPHLILGIFEVGAALMTDAQRSTVANTRYNY